jgi:hypothetical protein
MTAIDLLYGDAALAARKILAEFKPAMTKTKDSYLAFERGLFRTDATSRRRLPRQHIHDRLRGPALDP